MGASTTSRNRRLALALGATVCGMVGLAYASVPLYQLFCQVTGYGGTTKVAEAVPGEIELNPDDVSIGRPSAVCFECAQFAVRHKRFFLNSVHEAFELLLLLLGPADHCVQLVWPEPSAALCLSPLLRYFFNDAFERVAGSSRIIISS